MSKEEPSTPVFLAFLRRVIGIGFILAGITVMDSYFWAGYGLVIFGFVLSFVEICTDEALIKRAPQWIQIGLIAICLAAFDVVTFSLIKREAPFADYSYSSMDAQYPDQITDLKLSLTNKSEDDYKDIDVNIYPDAWVYRATCPKCSIEPLPKIGGVCFAISKGGARKVEAINTGGETECQNDVGDVFKPAAYGPNPGFRLQCSKLSTGDTIQVVLELVTIKSGNQLQIRQNTKEQSYDTRKPDTPGGHTLVVVVVKSVFDLFGSRPIPTTIYLFGHYKRNKQPFSMKKRPSYVQRAN